MRWWPPRIVRKVQLKMFAIRKMEERKMKRMLTCIFAAIALAAAVSALAGTKGNTPAEQACLEAFMNNLAETYQPAPRLREANFVEDPGANDSETSTYSWDLTATNPRNNQTVARATCVVQGSDAVLTMLQPSKR